MHNVYVQGLATSGYGTLDDLPKKFRKIEETFISAELLAQTLKAKTIQGYLHTFVKFLTFGQLHEKPWASETALITKQVHLWSSGLRKNISDDDVKKRIEDQGNCNPYNIEQGIPSPYTL